MTLHGQLAKVYICVVSIATLSIFATALIENMPGGDNSRKIITGLLTNIATDTNPVSTATTPILASRDAELCSDENIVTMEKNYHIPKIACTSEPRNTYEKHMTITIAPREARRILADLKTQNTTS